MAVATMPGLGTVLVPEGHTRMGVSPVGLLEEYPAEPVPAKTEATGIDDPFHDPLLCGIGLVSR